MSCNHVDFGEDCVCEIVRAIIDAQDQVNGDNCCTTGCEQSIADLLSPATNGANGNNTIPFILYCKGDCDAFVASSVVQRPAGGGGVSFNCITSPIFRAKKFVDDEECCVVLELLQPVNADGNPVTTGDEVCDFFPDTGTGPIRNLRSTGVCITVDLNCFCGIACLDPTTPLAAA